MSPNRFSADSLGISLNSNISLVNNDNYLFSLPIFVYSISFVQPYHILNPQKECRRLVEIVCGISQAKFCSSKYDPHISVVSNSKGLFLIHIHVQFGSAIALPYVVLSPRPNFGTLWSRERWKEECGRIMRCLLKPLFRSVTITFTHNKLFKASHLATTVISEVGICNSSIRRDVASHVTNPAIEGVGTYNPPRERRRQYLE